MSYDDIERALNAIIEDSGQENFAAAKRVELLLDKMLTKGYKTAYGQTFAPNEQYIRLKQEIPGAAVQQDTADTVLDDLVFQKRTQSGKGEGKISYQIRSLNGKTVTVIDTQNDTRELKAAETYLKTLVNAEHPFSTILVDEQPVYVGKDLPGEYKASEYTKSMKPALRRIKMQAATNLDEMLLLAENGEWRKNIKAKHAKDAKNGWYRYEAEFAVPVLDAKKAIDHYTVYGGTLLIRNDADGKSYLYDLLDVEKKKVISKTSFSADSRSEVTSPKPSEISIPTPPETVKRKISKQERGASNREILATALDSAAQNPREREVLAEYKDAIGRVEGYEARLNADRAELKRLSFAPGKRDMQRINELKNEIRKNESRVRTVDRRLLQLESMESMKNLLAREKTAIEKKEAQRRKEAVTNGNGLGLAIVKKIIDLHGGHISVCSSDKGSTFEVILPISLL